MFSEGARIGDCFRHHSRRRPHPACRTSMMIFGPSENDEFEEKKQHSTHGSSYSFASSVNEEEEVAARMMILSLRKKKQQKRAFLPEKVRSIWIIEKRDLKIFVH